MIFEALKRGMTSNRSELAIDPGPGQVAAPLLPIPPREVVDQLRRIGEQFRTWSFGSVEGNRVEMRHHSAIFGFTDDVQLTLTAEAQGTRVTGWSQSRIGRGDLGQNRRNLMDLCRRFYDPKVIRRPSAAD